jgi:hypothetical protein
VFDACVRGYEMARSNRRSRQDPDRRGSGSWSPLAYARALAEQTDVDFICIHIYPITGPMLNNAREMARVAHVNRKQAAVDEAWLQKILKPGGGNNVAASADVFRPDTYAFWQPLDQKFIALMLRMATGERIALVSFLWTNQLFAHLGYTSDLDVLS